MNKIITLAITAVGPVLLVWVLGLIKLPDSVFYIDYSRGGSELLNVSDELKKEVRIFVGEDEKKDLSLYSVHFINESSKNFDEIEIEFKIEGFKDTELITTLMQGPENYSSSAMHKKSQSNESVFYSLDYMNRAGDYDRNYFLVNFLFAGKPPKKITPISNGVGVEFRPSSENNRGEVVVIIMFSVGIVAYIWLLLWGIRRTNEKLKENESVFFVALSEHIEDEFGLEKDLAKSQAENIQNIRDGVFKKEGIIKKYLRKVVSEK